MTDEITMHLKPREAFVLGLRIIWEAVTSAPRRHLVVLTFQSRSR